MEPKSKEVVSNQRKQLLVQQHLETSEKQGVGILMNQTMRKNPGRRNLKYQLMWTDLILYHQSEEEQGELK